jgi:hypothetical protein
LAPGRSEERCVTARKAPAEQVTSFGLEQADEHRQEHRGDEREHETSRRAAVDTYRTSPLAASAEHSYFFAVVFLGAARRLRAEPFPLATSPVGSFESPAFRRSFSAISAISCGA